MRELFPIIENVKVDLKSLISIKHKCDPGVCNGKISCCAEYEICMEKDEVDKIIAHTPGAAEFAPQLKTNGLYNNVFDETDDNLITIDVDEDSQCLFAWRNSNGEVLCSLHSHAIKSNLSFYDTKPGSCCLWPLAIYQGSPEILTSRMMRSTLIVIRNRNLKAQNLIPKLLQLLKTCMGIRC